jgi:hypothetical protein
MWTELFWLQAGNERCQAGSERSNETKNFTESREFHDSWVTESSTLLCTFPYVIQICCCNFQNGHCAGDLVFTLEVMPLLMKQLFLLTSNLSVNHISGKLLNIFYHLFNSCCWARSLAFRCSSTVWWTENPCSVLLFTKSGKQWCRKGTQQMHIEFSWNILL